MVAFRKNISNNTAAVVESMERTFTDMTFYLTCILCILNILLFWLSIKMWLLKNLPEK